jgi:hypothetical protein
MSERQQKAPATSKEDKDMEKMLSAPAAATSLTGGSVGSKDALPSSLPAQAPVEQLDLTQEQIDLIMGTEEAAFGDKAKAKDIALIKETLEAETNVGYIGWAARYIARKELKKTYAKQLEKLIFHEQAKYIRQFPVSPRTSL